MSCSSTRPRAVAAVVVDSVPLARASFFTQCSVDDTCWNDVPANSMGQGLLGRDALRHSQKLGVVSARIFVKFVDVIRFNKTPIVSKLKVRSRQELNVGPQVLISGIRYDFTPSVAQEKRLYNTSQSFFV